MERERVLKSGKDREGLSRVVAISLQVFDELPLSDDHTVSTGNMTVSHCQMISQRGDIQSHTARGPGFQPGKQHVTFGIATKRPPSGAPLYSRERNRALSHRRLRSRTSVGDGADNTPIQ